jgi:hypothetical protein
MGSQNTNCTNVHWYHVGPGRPGGGGVFHLVGRLLAQGPAGVTAELQTIVTPSA